MEYCQKGSLYDFLHSHDSFVWSDKIRVSIQIAKGLSYLHSHSIIHRDLKSLNVLLTENLQPKIGDFGLSRYKDTLTTMTTGVGTPIWMAPELLLMEDYDYRADIYSYGVILWEIETREKPFNDLMPQQIMMKAIQKMKQEEIPKETPQGLAKIISQCWSHRQEDRPELNQVIIDMEKLKH